MKAGSPIAEKVRHTLSRHRMIEPEDRVIVAVSGGPDSVALLHLLYHLPDNLRSRLVVAHFDHGLRPREDESETTLVRGLADSMGLPFEAGKSRGTGRAGVSLEEAAREARYGFLEAVRTRHGARKIAVAHTLNDQAETFLMRLLMGSGPAGLSGIPPVRDGMIIRPFIDVTRAEIEAYLKEHHLPYAIDSSNTRAPYLRNRIRLELIPLLLKYQPRLIEHLGEMASSMREEGDTLDALSGEWIEKEAAIAPEGELTIAVDSFLALPAALRRRVTRRLLLNVSGGIRRMGRSHIRAIENLASSFRPQGSLDLPNRLTVRREYDRLCFAARPAERTPDFSYLAEGPGMHLIGEIGKTLFLTEKKRLPETSIPASPFAAFLDADKARFPLLIRNFRPGDRFVPLGMKGHRKLKDFFVDLKVPRDRRRSTPILIREETLVWVCGYRIDERFKVTPSTRKILEARLQ